MPLTCGHCPSTFTRQDNLKRHEARLHSSVEFRCDICQHRPKNAEAMNRHIEFHSGKQALKCDICAKVLTTKNGLKHHRAAHTGDGRTVACEKCTKTYGSKQALSLHVLADHEHFRYACECGKVFVYEKNLTAHEVVCGKKSAYMCHFCGKRLKTKTTLKKHELSHVEKNTWVCPKCGKKFQTKSGHYKHTKSAKC